MNVTKGQKLLKLISGQPEAHSPRRGACSFCGYRSLSRQQRPRVRTGEGQGEQLPGPPSRPIPFLITPAGSQMIQSCCRQRTQRPPERLQWALVSDCAAPSCSQQRGGFWATDCVIPGACGRRANSRGNENLPPERSGDKDSLPAAPPMHSRLLATTMG